MTSAPVYLDCHASTPTDPRVLERMVPFFSEKYGNPGSLHAYGLEAAAAVEEGRNSVARLLNCSPGEVIFTSGATEANNLALKGFVGSCQSPPHLISSQAEHRAVLDPLRRLERGKASVTLLPVNREGRISVADLAEQIRPETRLVSLMLANNEIGSLNPVREICELCHARGILVHSDATQGVGKIPIDLQELSLDLVSFSGHKFYGPQGVGALIVRDRETPVRLSPLLEGGGQERRMRSGTLPVPLIVGLGVACELAGAEMESESKRLSEWRDRMWREISAGIPSARRNTPFQDMLPQNLNLTFPGVDGEQLFRRLTRIAISSGAACSAADPRPSHVLRAIGLSEADAKSSIRIGLGRFNLEEEIGFAVEYLIRTIRTLS